MMEATQHVTQTPRFTHDCDKCQFLGRHTSPHYGEVDLWYHGGTGISATVIARMSDSGPEYISGLSFSYGLSSELTEARLRAEALGYRDYDVYEALNYAVKGTPSRDALLKALPFTEEFQAYLAFQAGNLDRCYGLINHLTQLSKVSDPLYATECRIAKVLSAAGVVDEQQAWGLVAEMTEPFYNNEQ